jgi:hypothetical protein
MKKSNKKYYLIWVYGCTDPETFGPYKTKKERNKFAKELYAKEGDKHCYLPADTGTNGKLNVWSYTNGFFEEE